MRIETMPVLPGIQFAVSHAAASTAPAGFRAPVERRSSCGPRTADLEKTQLIRKCLPPVPFLPVVTFALAAACFGVPAFGATIQGRVLDPDGKPVAAARVASLWLIAQDGLVPYAGHGMLSDEQGRFSGELTTLPKAVLSVDARTHRG